jgi:NADH-quinone oxidoreductase subunit J
VLGEHPFLTAAATVDAHAVGAALFGPYLLGVELGSLLLLAGLLGAWHLRRRDIGEG